jgi:C4-dicarboxylate transporter, DctM subunit
MTTALHPVYRPRLGLTEPALEVLDLARHAILGTENPDGSAHLVPVMFLVDDGRIWIQTSAGTRVGWSVRGRALRKAILPLGFPVIVIGGIYTGFFSPTEAAAVSVLYAVLLEVFVFRDLSLRDIPEIALSTGMITAVVFILVGAGTAFSWVISFAQLPDTLIRDVLQLGPESGYATIMASIAIAFFLGCMFVDPIVVILILTPIFHPVAEAAGIDPVLVGVVVTLQVAIGSATPPFGCDIFTAIAVFRRPYTEVLRGTPPFIAILLASAALLIAFPQIALWLRDLAFDK